VTRALPWWLEEGSELCTACETYHHAEALVVCAWCDGSLCACCTVEVLVERIVVLCPGCAREAPGEASRAHEGRP
jgi:hypothetical protein